MEFATEESRSGALAGSQPSRAAESFGAANSLDSVDRQTVRVIPGNAGDHKLIHALLRAANQGPSYEDFLTWVDEPGYEPTDRLLIKFDHQIVAHLQVLDRLAWFEGVQLPIGGLQDLATLPEFRGAEFEQLLLSAAESRMYENQAVVAFARTDRPDVYRAAGWIEVRGQRHTRANVSDILSKLASASRSRHARSLRIRLWRHVELEALRNVYRHSVETAWGAVERSEQYWRWLVSRKAHHEIIVAVHGKDEWDELDKPSNIVGYAVVRSSRVVELCTLPGHEQVAARLLGRACQDAIEHDHRCLTFHMPTTDPLHELMLSADGSWCCDMRAGGNTWMLKLLDPSRWIEALYPVLLRRAKVAGVKRPCHLVFSVGPRKFRLELTRRSGRLVIDDSAAQPHVRCTPQSFAALLLGNLDIPTARNLNQLEFADAASAFRVAALFAAAPFWQSQFDLLRF